MPASSCSGFSAGITMGVGGGFGSIFGPGLTVIPALAQSG